MRAAAVAALYINAGLAKRSAARFDWHDNVVSRQQLRDIVVICAAQDYTDNNAGYGRGV